MRQALPLLALPLLLLGCSLAPNMHKPVTVVPAQFKEADGWVEAQPKDGAPDLTWWKAFENPELDALEDRAGRDNQTLKQALAQLDEANAAVEISRAGLFPLVSLDAGGGRSAASTTVANARPRSTYNDFNLTGNVAFETDLWGRVRNQVAAETSLAKASADDLATASLSVHAAMAKTYFMLRGYDDIQRLLDKTVAEYEKALRLTQNRHKGGVATLSDVTQAETQLEDAKTRAADTHRLRQQAEHAIAVLAGTPPSGFGLPDTTPVSALPAFSPDLPSTLLERRPDVASAERQMEAANADIGVARAAYFPDLTLVGSGGYESDALHSLFDAPSLFWSFGAAVTTPLFDAGRAAGLTHEARAQYDESVAVYRQSVLTAFQEVEDALSALHQLEIENRTQTAATKAAQQTLQQIRDRYAGGVANYLDVVVAENTALDAEVQLINIHTSRMIATVDLVQALGGGWQDAPPAAAATAK